VAGEQLSLRVLGPLEVWRAGEPVRLGAAKQRALLGLLLTRRSGVDGDLAVDALWGEGPPKGARNTLQVYVSSLRKALGREVIETTPAGVDRHLELPRAPYRCNGPVRRRSDDRQRSYCPCA
jgi:DNA-binding SARP family transcriptional activator